MSTKSLVPGAREAVLDHLSREAKPIDSIQQRPCFSVPSQTKNGHFYNVIVCPDNLPSGRCNCEAGHRGIVCGHLRAAFRALHDAPHDYLEAIARAQEAIPRGD